MTVWSWNLPTVRCGPSRKKRRSRRIGARGLRAVVESLMTGIMYEIPSDRDISKVIVTEECVRNGTTPTVVRKKAIDDHSQVS